MKKAFCKEIIHVFIFLSPFFNVDDVYFVSDIHSLISTTYRHSYEYYKLIVIDKISCTSRTYNLYNNIKNNTKGRNLLKTSYSLYMSLGNLSAFWNISILIQLVFIQVAKDNFVLTRITRIWPLWYLFRRCTYMWKGFPSFVFLLPWSNGLKGFQMKHKQQRNKYLIRERTSLVQE